MFSARALVLTLAVVAGTAFPPAVSGTEEPTPPTSTTPPASPATSAKAAPTIPPTTAGKLAAAYIAMFNSGSDSAAADWEKANRTPSRLKEADAAERAKRITQMRKDFGALTLSEIIDSSEDSVFVEVAAEKVGPVGLRFVLDPKNPGKLDFVEVSSGGPLARPEPVGKAEAEAAVNAVAHALEAGYVYPEVAKKMADSIRQNLARGGYSLLKTDQALARRIMQDLQAVSHDKHLGIAVAPPDMRSQAAKPEQHLDADHLKRLAGDNFGFRKTEVLPGNIGYIKFDFFAGEAEAHPTASAAMGFVAHCDAVIFDMRTNGGGSPEMIQYLTSYLFDQKTHLNDMIDRDGKTVEEYWTLDEVPGARIPASVPVYVLTAGRTFSGAEEFTYNLKNLKRATIIGETTGGGAHPVRSELIADHYQLRVPFMRANNPITKTNWEGTGVEPDIKVPASEALDRALEEARKAIAAAPGWHAKP